MKDCENIFKKQGRWNAYGKSGLVTIQNSPDKFIVDPTKLSKQKLDLIAAIPNIKGKKILEYGSGRGEFSVALAKLGAIVTGIDVGEDLVRLSRIVAKINDVKCDFIAGNIDKLEFDDNIFDFVVGYGILHHLPRKGVIDSLEEAYRVLKPEGRALFVEPVENSNVFNFIQNLFPMGNPRLPNYRPSILQRKEWKRYLKETDDRPLSNNELTDAKGCFREIEFSYYGLLIRLERLFPNNEFHNLLTQIDSLLIHKHSPIQKLGALVLVVYSK
jgi:ubiquinone/menaquinone biosynthesis C-methylase UbiE